MFDSSLTKVGIVPLKLLLLKKNKVEDLVAFTSYLSLLPMVAIIR